MTQITISANDKVKSVNLDRVSLRSGIGSEWLEIASAFIIMRSDGNKEGHFCR